MTAEHTKKKAYVAMAQWHRHTCLKFEPFSYSKHKYHRSKVLIQNRGQWVSILKSNSRRFKICHLRCAARVGYMVDPLQYVSVSDVFLPDHCPVTVQI